MELQPLIVVFSIMNRYPKRLGDFHLTKLVSAGTFSELWSADDLRTQRTSMLEILAPTFLGDKAMAKLLQLEFDHGQEIDHPNILRSQQLNTFDGIPFIVRDYFVAKSLRLLMNCRQCEAVLGSLQLVVLQIAAGLQHMHDRKWIHGNLNPTCILLNGTCELKLTGLYSARRFPQSKIGSWFSATHATGSLNYASPEQIQNEQVDPRSDIYSLGCVLFELLEGKTPYAGKSTEEQLQKHVSGGIPRVSKHFESIPSPFADLIVSMMQKNPLDRPNSMLIVQHEVNRIFEKELSLPDFFGTTNKPAESRSTREENETRGVRSNANLDWKTKTRNKVQATGATAFFTSRVFGSRTWKMVLCTLAVLLIGGTFYVANAMQMSQEGKEAKYLALFRGFANEIGSVSKRTQSNANAKEWDELGLRIDEAVENYAMEMPEGTSKRPDLLELGWAANLMSRAFVNRSGARGRDDILKVVESHLNNVEMHKQKMASKSKKDWQLRMRVAQRWIESDVVFWSLVGMNFIGGSLLVATFLRKRR